MEMNKIIRVPSIESYFMKITNGELVLIPKNSGGDGDGDVGGILEKNSVITEETFVKLSFKKSKILNCVIKNGKGEVISADKKKFARVLVDIWKSMHVQTILDHTKFNIKLCDENDKSGYIWDENLKFSFQYKDSSGTVEEIINMVKLNRLDIKLSVELKNGRCVDYLSRYVDSV